jgi:prolipoprotein diacylglyceryltransferase
VFLLFPYFPGLSLPGGIIGGILFVMLHNKRKKIPAGRILDFFALSFLTALPVGLLGSQLLIGMQDLFVGVLLPVIFLSTVFFSAKVLLPLNVRGELKDGSMGSLIVIILSSTLLIASLTHEHFELSFYKQFDNLLLLVLLIASLIVLLRQERKGQLMKKHLT